MSSTSATTKRTARPRRAIEAPHPFFILFAVMAIAAISTWFIPAGNYERAENEAGQSTVVPGSYTAAEANPADPFAFFMALHEGMVEASGIIFFIFVVGGAFGLLHATGAIESAIGRAAIRFRGKEILFIPVLMLLFGFAGATFGMFEEAIPFILIMVPIAIKLGFDSMVGAGVVLVGVSAGFTAAFANPFTIGVAQGIADVPLFSGMGPRIIFWAVFMAIAIAYVMFYAIRVKKDPKRSVMYGLEGNAGADDASGSAGGAAAKTTKVSLAQTLTLVIVLATLLALAICVTRFGWYLTEISALFLIMALLIGAVNRMRPNQIFKNFAAGCEGMVVGALCVGFAYGCLVLLQNAEVIDTIVHALTSAMSGLPSSASALGMLGVQSGLNFIITSGSGQAALSMPIMTPLADIAGVDRQTAVLAFQMGDGISNIVSPTSGLLLAGLAMARINFFKWFMWVWPLIVIQYLVAALFVTVAHVWVWPV